ncbi:MAG: iron-containing alcohol dehydrogenase [Dehalobacterium sp.]
MYNFSFYNPVKSEVGKGKHLEVGRISKGQKIMLVSDNVIASMPFYFKIKEILGNRVSSEYTEVVPNPEVDNIDRAIEVAVKHRADCIIGIGGGSVLDASKMLAMAALNGGSSKEYLLGKRKIGEKRLPLILCPTTAGTGSEVTNVAVIGDHSTNTKLSLCSSAFYADISLIDPLLMETAPSKIIAAAGIDVLMHAVECYWNKNSTPVSDALAMYAIKLVVENLEKSYAKEEEANEQMAIASYIAGLAFNQTRTTAAHACGMLLTFYYGIDHGPACALTLVPLMKYNYEDPSAKEKLDVLSKYCGYCNGLELTNKFSSILETTKIPTKLSQYNIPEDAVQKIADAAVNGGYSGITKLNPREVSYAAMVQILSSIYD